MFYAVGAKPLQSNAPLFGGADGTQGFIKILVGPAAASMASP
jgi:hypothetical protein